MALWQGLSHSIWLLLLSGSVVLKDSTVAVAGNSEQRGHERWFRVFPILNSRVPLKLIPLPLLYFAVLTPNKARGLAEKRYTEVTLSGSVEKYVTGMDAPVVAEAFDSIRKHRVCSKSCGGRKT